MEKELIEILREYIAKVNSVKPIMFADFGVETKEQLIEKRLSYMKGDLKLPSNHKYMFHGRGCYFTSTEFEIDWDFGYYETWCGVNPGAFLQYLFTEYDLENNYPNLKMIQGFINEMVESGILVKKYDLYYFIKEIKGSNKTK